MSEENPTGKWCVSRPDVADRGVLTVPEMWKMTRGQIIAAHELPLDHEDETYIPIEKCLNCGLRRNCPDAIGKVISEAFVPVLKKE